MTTTTDSANIVLDSRNHKNKTKKHRVMHVYKLVPTCECVEQAPNHKNNCEVCGSPYIERKLTSYKIGGDNGKL